MEFMISLNAINDFKDEFGDVPVLIDVLHEKVKLYWKDIDEGQMFYEDLKHPILSDSHQLRIEYHVKNIITDQDIYAPTIAYRSDPSRFVFLDGRHTFEALERTEHKYIKICVPYRQAAALKELLGCS